MVADFFRPAAGGDLARFFLRPVASDNNPFEFEPDGSTGSPGVLVAAGKRVGQVNRETGTCFVPARLSKAEY